VRPGLRELIDTLPIGETLPPLPQTGWEETTVLAAPMAADPEAFVRGLVAENLVVAGRCANLPELRVRLSEDLLDELRWALVARSRDPAADLRARIAAALELGGLGDPRFERRLGPFGEYLMPPLVEIPGGLYPIGDDEPIAWEELGEGGRDTAHIPRHMVELAPYRIGRYLVTNAEWRCFVEAGGYEDERWWETEDARAWRRGELANQGAKANNRAWRKHFQAEPDLFDQQVLRQRFADEETVERWRYWMALDDAAFEAAIEAHWKGKRATEPAFWRDARCNAAAQPVVGVCWYEARAYCGWLSAQTGLAFRLPASVEWEAAARGPSGRTYAYGDQLDAAKANTQETHLLRPTPVGVFVEGDTPEGICDMAGNVEEWMSTAWGDEHAVLPDFGYPYDPSDGREDPRLGPNYSRLLHGGLWHDYQYLIHAAHIRSAFPDNRGNASGFRCCGSIPASGKLQH